MLEMLSATGTARVTRRLKFSCESYNDNKILLNLENCKLVSARYLNLTYTNGAVARALIGGGGGGGGGGLYIHAYDLIRS